MRSRSSGTKYNSHKVTVQGETYDSQKEYRRACELRLLERAGEISKLQRQVKFELIPAQKIDGKVVKRATNYMADFTYFDKTGNFHVEDVKGYKQGQAYALFSIKSKLMLQVHGILVEEV